MLIMREDMVLLLKTIMKHTNCGRTKPICLKALSCTSSFLKEESTSQLEKMTMPLNVSMSVGLMLKKSII